MPQLKKEIGKLVPSTARSLARVAACGKAMEIRMFFALPDLRELNLGKPQGLRARDDPQLPM